MTQVRNMKDPFKNTKAQRAEMKRRAAENKKAEKDAKVRAKEIRDMMKAQAKAKGSIHLRRDTGHDRKR